MFLIWILSLVAVHVQRVCQGFAVSDEPVPNLPAAGRAAFGDEGQQRIRGMKKDKSAGKHCVYLSCCPLVFATSLTAVLQLVLTVMFLLIIYEEVIGHLQKIFLLCADVSFNNL